MLNHLLPPRGKVATTTRFFSPGRIPVCHNLHVSDRVFQPRRLRQQHCYLPRRRRRRRHTCPPRDISRVSARCTISSVPFMMYVVTFCLLAGGLKMVLRSRIPVRDMCSVRGIGVAVRVSTSTPVVKTLRRVRGDAKKKEKRGRGGRG